MLVGTTSTGTSLSFTILSPVNSSTHLEHPHCSLTGVKEEHRASWDMFSGVNFDLLRRGGGEFPHHHALVLLERHVVADSGVVSSTDHVADQLHVTHSPSAHRLGEGVEDVAHRRLGMREHHRQLIALRERRVDGQCEGVGDREVLLQIRPIRGSYGGEGEEALPKG